MRKYNLIILSLIVVFACKKETTGRIDEKIEACFNYTPSDKIQVGDTIRFVCCESDSLSYFWDFGDGKSSNQKDPFHIYTMPDSFKVNLIVKKNNLTDSIAKYVMVLKKEETKYDTIYPLQYFPAFPGSYWNYSNGKSLQMEDQYQIFYYDKAPWGVKPVCDTIYLPKFKINSIYGYSQSYVYGYEISTGTFRLPLRQILSEVVGPTFQTSEIFGGNASYGKTIKKDTSMVINGVKFDNVLIVINYFWNQHIGNLPWNIKEYYAKDVGLIKRESRDLNKPTIITVDFELISYKINR